MIPESSDPFLTLDDITFISVRPACGCSEISVSGLSASVFPQEARAVASIIIDNILFIALIVSYGEIINTISRVGAVSDAAFAEIAGVGVLA